MTYIHQISQFDIDNDFGQGPVVSVFFNFCSFHCSGCWNKDTWDRKEELYWDNTKAAQTIIDALQKLLDRGMKVNLSLLGGDPLVDENIDDTLAIIKMIRQALPETVICVWTGFDVEDWWRRDRYGKQKASLDLIDYLVDGRFIHKLKTKNQMFGSINQRVLDAHRLRHSQGDKQAVFDALVYPDKPLTVLGLPGFETSARQLMRQYMSPTNTSRLYQQSVLKSLPKVDRQPR